jgi:hypothetical protein
MHRLYPLLAAILFIGPAMAWTQTPSATVTNPKFSADQVSFYEVPLACPAARKLGCGSAAKPVLLALEKKDIVQEAWLDHAGTTLAIVWKKGAAGDARAAEIRSIADDRGISLHDLAGEHRDETLKSFAARTGWYRGAEVDRLSAEEAAVITDRLILRATRKAPTIADKSGPLRTAMTNVIREQLTGCTSTQCRQDCHKKIVVIARKNLNDEEFNALMEAEKQGYRPIGDER